MHTITRQGRFNDVDVLSDNDRRHKVPSFQALGQALSLKLVPGYPSQSSPFSGAMRNPSKNSARTRPNVIIFTFILNSIKNLLAKAAAIIINIEFSHIFVKYLLRPVVKIVFIPVDILSIPYHVVKRKKGGCPHFFYIVILFIFLWTNVIQADLLAPSTNLPVLYRDAAVDLIVLDVIKTLSSEDMGDIKVFYEKGIEEEIWRRGKDVRCFGVRDISGEKGKWAFYVVDLQNNEIIRYTSARGVKDRFYDILINIDPPAVIERYPYKRCTREEIPITPKNLAFIKTCLDRIYIYPITEELAVNTIEDIFSNITYTEGRSLFSLLLAQTPLTPDLYKRLKKEGRWNDILRYIADSSFLDRWYLEKLKVDNKFISVIEASRSVSEGAGWLRREAPELEGKNLVYISPEAKLLGGLKSLMAGGLGVLAGELLVGFGDIGMNTHGVSLLYKKMLVQDIDNDGNQVMHEVPVDYSVLPIKDTGLVLDVAIGDRTVKVKVWEMREGKARVFLLDTDVEGNSAKDRKITEVLYGGSKESARLRLSQYIVLGRGAVLACEKMNIPIDFLHLNEAHTVISAYDLKKKGDHAKIIFTTHTPVEAGLPRFDLSLINMIDSDTGRAWEYFHRGNYVDLTHAALKMADMANGVSQEHRNVTVRRWAQDYRKTLIGITNGVDVPYWQMPDLSEKKSAKRELLEEVNRRTGVKLDEDALTIVLSRRITGYKRATMILEDLDRLAEIINTSGKPVQIIFAGNTHPKDAYGLEMIKRIVNVSKQDRFKSKLVFVPNYNTEFAKLAVRGADVWLINPEPEEEACATSYAKALRNGTIVISTYTGGPMEHVADGESGFFIRPYNVDTLYKCITKARDLYYDRPDVWRRMMENATKASVEIRDVAREYVRKAFLVSLLKDKFQREAEISNMQPAPRQEVIVLTEDDAPEITVQVELGSLKPEYINVYTNFGPEGNPSGWQDIEMVLDSVIDEKQGIYLYKGRVPITNLQPGRYGFTTKVSLMGLKEEAFCKWHSWPGNDGVLVVKDILSLYPEEIAWVREHAKRVARIAEIIASRMQLGDELIRLIRIAALAHDLGKGSSAEMIEATNSSGPKMEILDRHREESINMLQKAGIVIDPIVEEAVRNHHDPWLAEAGISRLVTEIIYLADQIDASQDSHRPYPTTMISLQQLMSEFRSYYKIGERVSKPVYKAFHRLLIEGQPDLMDVIYSARGDSLDSLDILDNSNSLLWQILNSGSQEEKRKAREIMLGRIRSLKGLEEDIKGRLIGLRNEGRILVSDDLIDRIGIFLYGSYLWHAEGDTPVDKDVIVIVPNSDIYYIGLGQVLGIDYIITGEENSVKDEESSKILNLQSISTGIFIKGRMDPESYNELGKADVLNIAEEVLVKANEGLTVGIMRKVWLRAFDSLLYIYLFVNSHRDWELKKDFNDLATRHLGSPLDVFYRKYFLGQLERLPWQDPEIETNIRDFIRDLELFIERCKAETSDDEDVSIRVILGLIIPDRPELIEVVVRWCSDNRFFELPDEEQERVLGEIDKEEIRQAVRNLQNIIRLFNDLGEAEGQRTRVVKRFDGVRIMGKVSDRIRRLIGYLVRNERLDLPETPDITRPRYIVVNKDRKKSRLENILRERYDIHVVTEIPEDGEFVVLVNPEDVGRWEGRDLLYLPLPYMEQSLKLAARKLLGDQEIVRDYVKGFYNILLGRKLTEEEVEDLFHKPWWILPEITRLKADLIILLEAISQLEKSA